MGLGLDEIHPDLWTSPLQQSLHLLLSSVTQGFESGDPLLKLLTLSAEQGTLFICLFRDLLALAHGFSENKP